MPSLLLLDGGDSEVLARQSDMRFHLRDRFVGDIQSKFFLAFRQPDPEFPPGRRPHLGGEEVEHFLAWEYKSGRQPETGMTLLTGISA